MLGENMTKQDKIDTIRNNIITGVQVYANKLAGKYYLYIFEGNCFEMCYDTDNFMHLTGADTRLSPNQFYEPAKNGHLSSNQLLFHSRYPLSTAMKKSASLTVLEKFVKEGFFVIKDLVTDTCTYPYAITNIDQSVLMGLKSEVDTGEIYVPKSLRIKGNIFNKAKDGNIFEIKYILSKTDIQAQYDTILYQEDGELDKLGDDIKNKICEELWNKRL